MQHARSILTLVAAGACALAVASTAAADSSKPVTEGLPAAAPTAGKPLSPPADAAAVPAKAPKGYVVVKSGPLTAPSGQQTGGSVSCPTGLVPLGGGVSIVSLGTLAAVNSTFPLAHGWTAAVNNGTGEATTFEVRAVCAAKPKGYRIVQGPIKPNPAGAQSKSVAKCPAGTKRLGGGGLSSSAAVFVNLNTSAPVGPGWRVDANNATGTDATITAFGVCGNVPGYQLVVGPPQTVFAQAQSPIFADCPAGKVLIGGGVFSHSTSLGITINVTNTQDPVQEWESFMNNSSIVASTATAYAACAGG